MSHDLNTQLPENLSESAVADYLRANPEFFSRHQRLLSILKLPHPTGGAVSLVERQMSILRQQNRQMDRKLRDIMQIAQENEHLSSRLHKLAQTLLRTHSLDDVLATVKQELQDEFRSDAVVLHVFTEHFAKLDNSVAQSAAELQHFDDLFKHKRPICGRLTDSQLDFLFADQASELQSAVVLPLIDQHPLGLLALGSKDGERFHPGMGTLFIGYLGNLVSAALHPYQTP